MSRKSKLAWFALLPTALGIVATSVGLAFDLFPGLRPDEPCQGTLGGELSELTVDESITRGEYLELTHADTSETPADRLDDIGKLVKFDVRAEGFRDERVTVWTSVLTSGGAPVDGLELSNQLALALDLEECRDGGRRTVWTLTPERHGSYLIELRLLDPDDEELDSARTPPFTVAA
jgi:hypothetical protein